MASSNHRAEEGQLSVQIPPNAQGASENSLGLHKRQILEVITESVAHQIQRSGLKTRTRSTMKAYKLLSC